MNPIKQKNMLASYTGFRGAQTLKAVQDQVPKELFDRLTGHELGLVMNAVNTAYHNGRAALGGIDLCDDAVWLPFGGSDGEGQLIPISTLRRLDLTKEIAPGE